MKKFDLLGCKVCSFSGLQLFIGNYQTILVKYDFLSYSKLVEFQAFLPPEQQQAFQALLDEGKLVAKVALQAMVDTVSCSLAHRMVLCRDSWLQSFSFPKEIQIALEGLPFDSHKLQ
ncbi:hypothetical protein UY3_05780 [Chelonia mydas]|uniref:Uncharacterized protein n=1 Tax=Chelonia mydas TaxID=8469 RepID=M7BIF5_CHEMY|nr:hypothetical protein UY3_05780 [Chelonia mydas]